MIEPFEPCRRVGVCRHACPPNPPLSSQALLPRLAGSSLLRRPLLPPQAAQDRHALQEKSGTANPLSLQEHPSTKTCLQRSRVAFDLPELVQLQRASFNSFIKDGIPDLFSQLDPIRVERDNTVVELVINGRNYQLIAPDDTPRDCIFKMKTYSCQLYVEARVCFRTLSGELLGSSQSEWVLIGHLPIMTKRGHFIINGSPKVVVHQVVRSPGVYFQQVAERQDRKRIRFYGDIIPRRGVWLRLQITQKGKIEAKLKKGRKVSADMLQNCFESLERFERTQLLRKICAPPPVRPDRAEHDIMRSHTDQKDRLGVGRVAPRSRSERANQSLQEVRAVSSVVRSTVQNEITEETLQTRGIANFASVPEQNAFLYTYDKLYRPAEEKEREEMSRKGRNSSATTNPSAELGYKIERCYKNLFFTFKDKRRYDLGDLGRDRINTKLGIDRIERQLSARDIHAASCWLHQLTKGERGVDDIDNSQNRRVRSSGELLHIQFENGIDRLRRLAFKRLNHFVHLQSQQRAALQADTETRKGSELKSRGRSTNRFLSVGTPELNPAAREEGVNPVEMPNLQKRESHTDLFGFDWIGCLPETRAWLKELFTTKPVNGALRELFGSNPLSQYMDQTNPLAEITHKRRMSCLGAGGVSRDSAGMAIRGIHRTHYGRICPIETPEGKNAGLVNSLAFYARTDENGFIETPYYRVAKGQVQRELGFSFFSAKQEIQSDLKIAPSDCQQSWSNSLRAGSVPVRVAGNLLDLFTKTSPYQVNSIGISPVQMISVATSLIPFLEHNDANRALMGSNMQRQAVPLMIPERPIVGTGFESLVLAESGHLLESQIAGFVSYVSGNRIRVEGLHPQPQEKGKGKQIRSLPSSNPAMRTPLPRSRCTPIGANRVVLEEINGMLPAVQPAADVGRQAVGACAQRQRLADQGTRTRAQRNILPPGRGRYVFQLESKSKERTLQVRSTRPSDRHTHGSRAAERRAQPVSSSAGLRSSLVGRSSFTIYGRTEIDTRTASSKGLSKNVSLQHLWQTEIQPEIRRRLMPLEHRINSFDRSNQDTCLTERALVREGDWVQKGDVLTDCSASENGELAVGKNILVAYIPWEGYNFEDAIVISERLVKEDVLSSLHIERYDFAAQSVKEGREWFTNDLPGISGSSVAHLDESGLPKIGSFVKEGDILVGKIRFSNTKPTTPYERLLFDILGENNFSARDSSLYVPKGVHARVVQRNIIRFVEDQSGVRTNPTQSPKLVHIFLGEKRAIQVGDKMSGRHGNKGVVAKILPRQDMPYLPNGTPVDIILNPLGVPSRMNVGQVFEALLGLAGTYLAQQFKIMAFDELYGVDASQSVVYLKLYQARLQSGENWLFQVDSPGKTRLIDGRSGECFDQSVTVGRAYILKLIHMVNEKIHARATGPYAFITQQPLRGRSQKGGQRLGEMEVWALEGFGAAYTLQELCTLKSDDMVGRKELPSHILPRPTRARELAQPAQRRRENRLLLGQPEIFKVLICELQALCLDVGVYSLTAQSFQRTFRSKLN